MNANITCPHCGHTVGLFQDRDGRLVVVEHADERELIFQIYKTKNFVLEISTRPNGIVEEVEIHLAPASPWAVRRAGIRQWKMALEDDDPICASAQLEVQQLEMRDLKVNFDSLNL